MADDADVANVEAFRILFGAVSLPFGAMLGGVVTDMIAAKAASSFADALMLGLQCTMLFLFFAAVVILFEGFVRRNMPQPLSVRLLCLATVLACAFMIPQAIERLNPWVWGATVSAWIVTALFALFLTGNARRGVR